MTKAELIDSIKGTKDLPELSKKAIAELVDVVFTSLADAIKKDGKFSYKGFGTFSVQERKARKGRNPKTGKVIDIKASKTVKFKPTPEFRKSLG